VYAVKRKYWCRTVLCLCHTPGSGAMLYGKAMISSDIERFVLCRAEL
jgi:cytochrome c oxidase assembly factor CtaG